MELSRTIRMYELLNKFDPGQPKDDILTCKTLIETNQEEKEFQELLELTAEACYTDESDALWPGAEEAVKKIAERSKSPKPFRPRR